MDSHLQDLLFVVSLFFSRAVLPMNGLSHLQWVVPLLLFVVLLHCLFVFAYPIFFINCLWSFTIFSSVDTIKDTTTGLYIYKALMLELNLFPLL